MRTEDRERSLLTQEWLSITFRREWRKVTHRIVWVVADGAPVFSFMEEL